MNNGITLEDVNALEAINKKLKEKCRSNEKLIKRLRTQLQSRVN